MRNLLLLPIFALLTSCAAFRPGMRPTTEYVLTDGMTISATTKNGVVSIAGKKGTKRVFSGDGWSKTRCLIPRDVRWYGSLGLYDPAGSFSPYGRLLVDEGRLFFESKSDALQYLRANYFKPVFNNHGLAVGYRIATYPGKEATRSVEVWQIYINGKRPDSLRGANDAAFKVVGGKIPDFAKPYPAVIGHKMELY